MAREKAGLSIGLCIVVFYPLTRLLGRRRFEGLEHIPATGPVLVVCNHVSPQRPRDGDLLREVTDRVMGQVRDLLAKVRREPAPTGFFGPTHPGEYGEQAS